MSDTKPMSVTEWMLTLLILAIPVVNIIMYLYWALSDSGNLNRKNFCIASLAWFLILCGVAFVVGGILFLIGYNIGHRPLSI